MLFFIILFALLSTGAVGVHHFVLTPRAQQAKAIRDKRAGLSRPARLLADEYEKIPSESRPFPDVYNIIRALDEKAKANDGDFSSLDSHFEHRWDYGQYSLEDTSCTNVRCRFSEYHRLHRAFDRVLDSIKEKEKAVTESRLKPDLDQIAELESRLRDEVELNRKFTEDYKELA